MHLLIQRNPSPTIFRMLAQVAFQIFKICLMSKKSKIKKKGKFTEKRRQKNKQFIERLLNDFRNR